MARAETAQRRDTRQRRVILEELKGVRTHPTAEEVYALARRKLPRISLGTVYRNLEGLAAEGVVAKIETPGSRKRFDGNPESHYHIRCLACGRIDDVSARLAPGVGGAVRGRTEYRVLGCRVEFVGLCPWCRNRKAGS